MEDFPVEGKETTVQPLLIVVFGPEVLDVEIQESLEIARRILTFASRNQEKLTALLVSQIPPMLSGALHLLVSPVVEHRGHLILHLEIVGKTHLGGIVHDFLFRKFYSL